jgi:hypothetical protein
MNSSDHDVCAHLWNLSRCFVSYSMPGLMLVFGKLTDSFNEVCVCAVGDDICNNACYQTRLDGVSKYALWLVYLGVIAFVGSWYIMLSYIDSLIHLCHSLYNYLYVWLKINNNQ